MTVFSLQLSQAELSFHQEGVLWKFQGTLASPTSLGYQPSQLERWILLILVPVSRKTAFSERILSIVPTSSQHRPRGVLGFYYNILIFKIVQLNTTKCHISFKSCYKHDRSYYHFNYLRIDKRGLVPLLKFYQSIARCWCPFIGYC